jgi:Domain of unknown function (DUF397)
MDSMTDPRWRKASYSGSNGGGCMEAGNGADCILVRDTMDPHWPDNAPVVKFNTTAWRKLLADVRADRAASA